MAGRLEADVYSAVQNMFEKISRSNGQNQIFAVVLGMHRSGTSLITNILSKAGFFVGNDVDLISQGKQWNRDGYFERWLVVKVNEKILQLCGGAWHSPPPEKEILGVKIDRIIESLLEFYEGRKQAVIKDPRLCLTFPVWERQFGDDVRIVRITRYPEAVASSLHKRDGFQLDRGLNLWRIYNERASRYVTGYPTYHLEYEDLFSDHRKQVLNDLSLFLGVESDLEQIAVRIVDPSLQHYSKDNLPFDSYTATRQEPQREYKNACRMVNKGAHNISFKDNVSSLCLELQHAGSNSFIEKETNGSAKPISTDCRPWWDYLRFKQAKVKVLLVSLRHLLLTEISNALEELGHSCRMMLIGGEELNRSDVEHVFTRAIKGFKPDFVLTVNHLGFDHEGVVTGLLTRYKVPFASWYVDSPHLIIRHFAENRSPYLALFLWDKDYLEVVRRLGFERVEYLPLGVDDNVFHHVNSGGNHLASLASDVSFVGNSMVNKVRSKLSGWGIKGPLEERFEEVALAFERSSQLVVRDMLEDVFPDLACELEKLPESQALGYETSITWQATGRYREALVKRLKPFKPLVVGDSGWGEILDDDFILHSELNYYADLPAFYSVTKVNFDATSRQMKNGVNQRVFDVPACGSLVITDWTGQLEDLMEPGREIIAYRDGDEIPDLVSKAIKDKRFRRNIARAGNRRVLSEHTYSHRLKRLIEVMKNNFG